MSCNLSKLTKAHTAAEAEFVKPLATFLHQTATDPETEHVKQIGICFGHQVLAIAFGGKCGRSEVGWEVGVYGVQLSDAGREILGDGEEGARVVSGCLTKLMIVYPTDGKLASSKLMAAP